MSLSLPSSISTYFEISNGSDIAQIGDCFTQDAVVVDEGQTYQGPVAIERWTLDAQKKYEYTVEPVSVTRNGNNHLSVIANVVGNFPGSPIRLDHLFDLAGDKIQSLKIG
ncbi:nuclear transport factor 2 family protein [Bordetella muralis]|jgi:hypothetical protein|uniref:nuclear transport factor 2 family protein n=1 Tax=Bordetella muralis TaxID=1649130 RepID=UPI0039EE8495